MQGNTSVGGGTIDYVLYVPEDNFLGAGYTDMYVTVKGAKKLNAFENKYFARTDIAEERLKALAQKRQTLRRDQFRADLAEAQEKYATAEREAREKLAGAKAQLERGAERLAGARGKYAAGLAAYQRNAAAAQELTVAKARLDDAAAQIAAGEEELLSKQGRLAVAESQLEAAQKRAEQAVGMPIAQIAFALPSMKAQLDNLRAQADALSRLAALRAARDSALGMPAYEVLNREYHAALQGAALTEEQASGRIAQLDALKSQLLTAQKQYDELGAVKNSFAQRRAEIDAARQQLAAAQSELAAAKLDCQNGRAEVRARTAEAKAKLTAAEAKLAASAEKISGGERELAAKTKEYHAEKAAVVTRLAAAKEKLTASQRELSQLGQPKWYVLDRELNEGFANYNSSTKRMRDLATVFPSVFFLVAALVCLTTMTRMVDEERGLIGTFKALGYANHKIAGRYLSYAASASLLGSVLGITVGFWLIPTIAWGAYGIAFALPTMKPAFYPAIGALSVLATVLLTTLSTGVAVKNCLRESPAALMRPKAPQSGKRVLLEYVKPVWRRLAFTRKVTIRNLVLNKKRLLMSLVGIVGCTALVVTAFGVKNAEMTILHDQFGEIFHYNVTISFAGSPSPKLYSRLADKNYFAQATEAFNAAAEASLRGDAKNTYNIYVVSPKDAEDFTDYVSLRDPRTRENFSFTDSSAVITEKLALNLHAGIGDTIWVKFLDGNEKHRVRVTGITTNYALNYVYLGKSAYQAAFGQRPGYNQFFAVMGGHSKEKVNKYLSSVAGVETVTFTDDLMGNIGTTLDSVDAIIWILIIAAGLLAFVVLYNLTNINISERQRELATLKVLGFYDWETHAYIFRETVILSLVGSLVGLVFGTFLYRTVIITVESDLLLLNRDLTWHGYLGAVLLTMSFTWLVNQCLKPRIDKIEMLESLKSVE